MRLFFLNPFWMMAAGFVSSMLLYRMGLSGLYDAPFDDMDWVFVLIITASIITGFLILRRLEKGLYFEPSSNLATTNLIVLLCLIWLGFIAEVFYEGGVPLVSSFSGKNYDYSQFGIPTFHVFFLSYCSAFAVVSFDRFMSGRGWLNLLPVLSVLLIELMIVNRGAILITFCACTLLYLFGCKRFGRSFLFALIAVLAVIVTFGYVGDKRMKASGYSEEGAIYKIGMADNFFLRQEVPSGVFWTYLYASSPYANLANQAVVKKQTVGTFTDFLNVALVPDFISKHYYDIAKVNLDLITPELNVATGFGRTFVVYGYLGVVLLFGWYLFFVSLFMAINRRFYLRSVVAVLCVMSLMMIFENMLIFASFIVQIVMMTLAARIHAGGFRFI